jgi:hypothetical protein
MDQIALVLLTLVGYSIGAVSGGRGRLVSPGLADVVFVLGLEVAGLFSRLYLDKWLAVGVWLIIAGVCSLVWTSARRSQLPIDKRSELAAETNALKRLWRGWEHFAQRMGNFQGRVLLAIFYFVVVTPFALLQRLLSDPLHLARRPQPSFWLSRSSGEADLEDAMSQF